MKPLDWFKWSASSIDNAKLRLLAREDRWNFVAVCCLKATGELDSDAPLFERRIAVKMELTPAEAVEVKRRLQEVGLIDDNWQPLSWPEHQPTVDNTAAERKRRQRDREKSQSQNVTVTSRDGHDTEIEEEKETEIRTPLPPEGVTEEVKNLDFKSPEPESEFADDPELEAEPDSTQSDAPAKIPVVASTERGAMAIALRDEGMFVSSDHAVLCRWVADGFNTAQVLDAMALARQSKPYPERINPGYVDVILRKPARDPPPRLSRFDLALKRIQEA